MSSSIPRSVSLYKRTVDHLRAWPFKLPKHLKIASINFNEFDKTHDGLRLFTYQHVPQLKFHNPGIKFVVSKKSPNCTIEFVGNGEEGSLFEVNQRSYKEIKQIVENLYPQQELESTPQSQQPSSDTTDNNL